MNKTLLVVDDDLPFRERLSRSMEKKGFEVNKIISNGKGPLFSADTVVKKLYMQNSFKKLVAKKLDLYLIKDFSL